jgi:hypothetical protein
MKMPGVRGFVEQVNEIATTAGKLLRMGDEHVLWYEPTFSTLHLAPLSVSHVLRSNLLRRKAQLLQHLQR